MNFPSRVTLFLARLLLVPLGFLLLPTGALAVSLGDELILSRLGDPVEVEIEVLQWEDMDLDRVQISAASREEYEVFKLTWLPVLEYLNFNLVGPDLNGNVRVLISSRDPLDEPFLELLLVLRWPGGSLRREYVLLFDPPGAPVAAIQTAQTAQTARTVQPMAPAPVQAEPEPAVASSPVSVVANVVEPPVQEPQPQIVVFVAPEPAPQLPDVVEETAPAVKVPTAAAPVVQLQPERIAAPIPVPQAAPAPAVAADVPQTPVGVTEPAVADIPPEVTSATPDEPVASAPAIQPPPEADETLADARTQVAIDVETLAPQAPATALDTTRRTYQVRSGDSLWIIARQFLPAGAGENLYQMLLGIHDLNRNSFINGNISLLKANALLQMPAEADIAAIDPGTAQAEFDRRWEAGTQRFDAAQRGEAIPLFVSETPVDEPAAPIEPDLPPGTEAPRPAAGDGGLVMVSATNAALPLQLAPAGDATIQADSLAMNPEPSVAPTTNVVPAVARNANVVPAAPDNAETAPAADIAVTPAAANTPQISTTQVEASTSVRVITTTAELETEVVAMRARREAAEAVARQLQESLQRAQAERTAQTDLLAPQNLPLAAGALALVVALAAGVVFMLKIAGELRTARVGNNGAFASARSLPTRLDARHVNPLRAEPLRTEPTWMESFAKAPDPQDPAQIEVVEMEPEAANAAAAPFAQSDAAQPDDAPAGGASSDAAPSGASPSGASPPGASPSGASPSGESTADPDDLFARMDNLLGATQKSPQK